VLCSIYEHALTSWLGYTYPQDEGKNFLRFDVLIYPFTDTDTEHQICPPNQIAEMLEDIG
jgi:hypothetical protein